MKNPEEEQAVAAERRIGNGLRDIAIGVLVITVGAAMLSFANIPSKVAVLENQQSNLQETVRSIDKKMDILLSRSR